MVFEGLEGQVRSGQTGHVSQVRPRREGAPRRAGTEASLARGGFTRHERRGPPRAPGSRVSRSVRDSRSAA